MNFQLTQLLRKPERPSFRTPYSSSIESKYDFSQFKLELPILGIKAPTTSNNDCDKGQDDTNKKSSPDHENEVARGIKRSSSEDVVSSNAKYSRKDDSTINATSAATKNNSDHSAETGRASTVALSSEGIDDKENNTDHSDETGRASSMLSEGIKGNENNSDKTGRASSMLTDGKEKMSDFTDKVIVPEIVADTEIVSDTLRVLPSPSGNETLVNVSGSVNNCVGSLATVGGLPSQLGNMTGMEMHSHGTSEVLTEFNVNPLHDLTFHQSVSNHHPEQWTVSKIDETSDSITDFGKSFFNLSLDDIVSDYGDTFDASHDISTFNLAGNSSVTSWSDTNSIIIAGNISNTHCNSDFGQELGNISCQDVPRDNIETDVIPEPNVDHDEYDKVLSIFFDGNCLGAAVYHNEGNKLEIMEDLPDTDNQFEILEMLLYQVEPDVIIVSSRQDENIINFIKGIIESQEIHFSSVTLVDEDEERVLCQSQLDILPGAQFALTSCQQRLKSIRTRATNAEQEKLKLSAHIKFNCVCMVRAGGALMKYIDRNYRFDTEEYDVLILDFLRLRTIMTMDMATLTSLQIFSSNSHLSGSTAGSWNKKREGLSIFQLLNKCSSVVGTQFLKKILRCPSGTKDVIERRQRDVSFYFNNANTEFCISLSQSLKKIKNVSRLLKRLSKNSMTVKDWQGLSSSITGIVEVATMADTCSAQVLTLKNVVARVSDKMFSLKTLIDKVINVKQSVAEGVLIINPGINKVLDKKRRLREGIPDLLYSVAVDESFQLPPGVTSHKVNYLAHIGFFLSIPRGNGEHLICNNLPGFQHLFDDKKGHNYKTLATKHLDATIGDFQAEITKMEGYIISQLTEAILEERGPLDHMIISIAQLDCLLAIGKVCRSLNWVKPAVTTDGDIVIKGGRHPLQEQTVSSFIPNDTNMKTNGGKVQVITGPNSSGKSIYLKQVGLIVYLAQVGCFVPADSASVPILSKIYTRIHTTESVSLGMSAFMCDVNQLATALNVVNPKTLLLVDEFGKGTSSSDGAALLAATVQTLTDKHESAPFSIFSTHFHCVQSMIKSSIQPTYLHMKTDKTGSRIVYYFKLTDGLSRFSHATSVARKVGIDKEVVKRANHIVSAIVNKTKVEPNVALLNGKLIMDTISAVLDLDLNDKKKVAKLMQTINELKM